MEPVVFYMSPDAGAFSGDSDGPETVRVVSPDRRVPLSIQMELADYGIIRTEQPSGAAPEEVLYLRRRPPDDLLERGNLTVTPATRELWRDPNGRLLEIRPGVVLIDGTETEIDPTEAREYVRAESYDPVDVPDDAGPVDD